MHLQNSLMYSNLFLAQGFSSYVDLTTDFPAAQKLIGHDSYNMNMTFKMIFKNCNVASVPKALL